MTDYTKWVPGTRLRVKAPLMDGRYREGQIVVVTKAPYFGGTRDNPSVWVEGDNGGRYCSRFELAEPETGPW